MRRLLAVFVAVAGIVGFATSGLAMCGGHQDVVDTSSSTVATDSTTPISIPTDQNGG